MVPFISAALLTSFVTTSDLSKYSTFKFVTWFAYSVKCLGFLLTTFMPLSWLCHLVLEYVLWNHYTLLLYFHTYFLKKFTCLSLVYKDFRSVLFGFILNMETSKPSCLKKEKLKWTVPLTDQLSPCKCTKQ